MLLDKDLDGLILPAAGYFFVCFDYTRINLFLENFYNPFLSLSLKRWGSCSTIFHQTSSLFRGEG
jgi:hypothetical protein